MLSFKLFLLLALLTAAAAAQQQAVLATSSLKNFTAADLSAETRSIWESRDKTLRDDREQFVSQMVTEMVLELEAKARNTTVVRLVENVKQKVADPTEAQIRAVYDANLQALESKPLNDVRKPIIQFLRRDQEEVVLKSYVDELAGKFKVVYVKDVNLPGLKPADVLFSIDGRAITLQDFDAKYRLVLYDIQADPIDEVRSALEIIILSFLVEKDAASMNIDQQTYIAREITNKMKQFSDEERADLENSLKRRLFAKYKVKLLVDLPPPIVQKISVDDDPAVGPLNAPVTIVMFADFQCSACAQTHPALKRVIAEFPGKIRFVMRDYPLENIHENAFNAALAANAAGAQGKYFEYGELLFRNQNALDGESLKKYAAQIGLNLKQFELDSSSQKAAAEVRRDMSDGRLYGITGTPTIFVNGVKVRRLSAEAFREAIENALRTSVRRTAAPVRR
jgi:protein-disulfide isomerase